NKCDTISLVHAQNCNVPNTTTVPYTTLFRSQRSSDLFGPKFVRSMQGSQFHLQMFEGDLRKWIDDFKSINAPTYGTQLNPQAKKDRKSTRLNSSNVSISYAVLCLKI